MLSNLRKLEQEIEQEIKSKNEAKLKKLKDKTVVLEFEDILRSDRKQTYPDPTGYYVYEINDDNIEQSIKSPCYDANYELQNFPPPTSKYYLLTITFDQKISMYLDEIGQIIRLERCFRYLRSYRYWACIEKHKSGICHGHVLLICDHHQIQPILNQIKKEVTNSVRLEPAINIKPIKQNKKDVDNSFDYIVANKSDHPKFKRLYFNR